jgi:hypothetical protein
MEVFKAFRDREPSTEALLRHSGLVSAEPKIKDRRDILPTLT